MPFSLEKLTAQDIPVHFILIFSFYIMTNTGHRRAFRCWVTCAVPSSFHPFTFVALISLYYSTLY